MTCRRRNGMALVVALAATFALAGTLAQAASARPLVSILSTTCLQPVLPINSDQFQVRSLVFTATCGPIANSGPQHWDKFDRGIAPIRGRSGHWNVYQFRNGAAGGCLSNRGRLFEGAGIDTDVCSTSSAQLWTLGRSGTLGSVELVNAASGMCLDVQGGFLGPNQRMIQWPCFPGTPFEGNLFFIP